MSLVRHALLALAMLSPTAAVAQAPASPPAPAAAPAPGAAPAVRLPGLSPAGNAALTRLNGKVDPAVAVQIRDEAAFRRQMAAILAAPTVDLDKLAVAMKRGQALAAHGRAIADDHLLTMLRVLSPADRVVMLRAISMPRRAPAPTR